LRDAGEAALVTVDIGQCRSVGEAKGLHDLRRRVHAVAAPAGRIADGLNERHRTQSDAVIVASKPGCAAWDQAVGADK
jgi:hypothetical protein